MRYLVCLLLVLVLGCASVGGYKVPLIVRNDSGFAMDVEIQTRSGGTIRKFWQLRSLTTDTVYVYARSLAGQGMRIVLDPIGQRPYTDAKLEFYAWDILRLDIPASGVTFASVWGYNDPAYRAAHTPLPESGGD